MVKYQGIRFGSDPEPVSKGKVENMATSNVPVRVPERQPEPTTTPRPAAWRPERKPSRFVIKIGGVIPT